jgi:hypothetical protein
MSPGRGAVFDDFKIGGADSDGVDSHPNFGRLRHGHWLVTTAKLEGVSMDHLEEVLGLEEVGDALKGIGHVRMMGVFAEARRAALVGADLVAHYVAGAAGGGELLADFIAGFRKDEKCIYVGAPRGDGGLFKGQGSESSKSERRPSRLRRGSL